MEYSIIKDRLQETQYTIYLPMKSTLIKKVVLYNDKIEIYYNYTSTKNPDDTHRDFVFYIGNKEYEVDTHKYERAPILLSFLIELYV